ALQFPRPCSLPTTCADFLCLGYSACPRTPGEIGDRIVRRRRVGCVKRSADAPAPRREWCVGAALDAPYAISRDAMLTISKMAAAVQPSATLAAAAKARQLKAEGINVTDFSLGEPDFNTPAHICDAATKAMREGKTHYTPANGIVELRKAIATRYKKD